MPQPPQLLGSVCELTSHPSIGLPLQLSCGSSKGFPHENPQTPPLQKPTAPRGSGHTFPHVPQLSRAFAVRTQVPLHRVRSDVQTHAPAVQTSALVHVTPQPPQFVLLERVSSSQPSLAIPLQFAKPTLQANPQTLAAHVAVALGAPGHTRPHIPQFVMLVLVSTHTPPQTIDGLTQVGVHTPPVQTDPAAHARPHAVQFAALVFRFTSQPLAAMPSQSPYPVLQLAIAHAPAAQPAVAWLNAHARPHALQLATLVRVSTSQPLPAMASQLPKPDAHANEHALPAQVGEALAGVGHTVPHAPQLRTSVASVAQVVPHATVPAPQVVVHTPAEHTCGLAHTEPVHLPQRALSVRPSTSQPLLATPSQFR